MTDVYVDRNEEAAIGLRQEYAKWQASAPSKPVSGTPPTPDQLRLLREHGLGYKEWKISLADGERALVQRWERCRGSGGAAGSRKRGVDRRRHEHEDTRDDDDASAAAATTSTKHPAAKPICRHWARTGGKCIYGDDCKFLHPILVDAPEHPPSARTHPHRSRTRPNRTNSNRASTFRRFLLDEYGESRLRSGSGVVEVSAGLSGGVSFELLNLNDVPCTAIEPRGPFRLGKRRWKLRRGIFHSTGPLQRYNSIGYDVIMKNASTALGGISGNYDATVAVGKSPRHWRLFFGAWMTNEPTSLRQHLSSSLENAASLKFAGKRAMARFCGHEEDFFQATCPCNATKNAIDDDDDDDADDDAGAKMEHEEDQRPPDYLEVSSTLRDASILIGMHPDQPTEDIVDIALKRSKPFAVVPCCVFPTLFSDRKLQDGTPVRSYDQFMKYLLGKDARIKSHDLSFGGRSVVLFFYPLGRETTPAVQLV